MQLLQEKHDALFTRARELEIMVIKQHGQIELLRGMIDGKETNNKS
jgi:hypothetical protein